MQITQLFLIIKNPKKAYVVHSYDISISYWGVCTRDTEVFQQHFLVRVVQRRLLRLNTAKISGNGTASSQTPTLRVRVREVSVFSSRGRGYASVGLSRP